MMVIMKIQMYVDITLLQGERMMALTDQINNVRGYLEYV